MRRWSLLIVLLLTASLGLQAKGIDFFHGSWEEALEEAKRQEKIIFIDAYTTWCGPCKRMAKTVFTDGAVGEFYNQNFICMKIDMEKEMGMKFQQKYPVRAYPTLYYIDGNGKVVHKVKGGRQAEQFIALGRSVLGKYDNSEEYAKAYEEGDRSPELVYKYVKALNKAGKSSLKIANDYIKSQKDLRTPDNLKFILEATTEADSRIFGLLIEHRSDIVALTSEEAVKERIEKACRKTAQKAVTFESEDLHEEAKGKMKAYYPEKAEEFSYQTDLNFYKTMHDTKQYVKVCNDYVKKVVKKDPDRLLALAKEISSSFSRDAKAMNLAEQLAKKSAKNGATYSYYYTYAQILLKNGKKKEAMKNAEKSLELAKDARNAHEGIKRLINQIKES
ncbi:MAG: thioredoxin family protein [Bacteroidota bacterium]